MDDNSGNAELIVQQKAVFRLLAAKGFTQDLLHHETKISTTSLSDYATGKTKLSLLALRRIARVPDIPLDLLSMLMPEGMAIVRVPEGIDYDDICEWAECFTAKKLAAHRADSEHQEKIGPNERNELDAIVVSFPGSAAA